MNTREICSKMRETILSMIFVLSSRYKSSTGPLSWTSIAVNEALAMKKKTYKQKRDTF